LARSRNPEDIAIDWNRVEGNWKEVKGKVKEKWAKLTDDDLAAINGQRDQLKGRLQKQYGYAKDQARKDSRLLDTRGTYCARERRLLTLN